jgi:hypothetical protein
MEEVLQAEFEKLRIELIQAYDDLGMRASGQWADSLEAFGEVNRGGIIGLKYTEQLEFGRRAGKFPPKDAIIKWINDKGIQPTDISISSLAFLIARKIAREGWNRERFGGVELISKVVTPQRIQQIIDVVVENEKEVLVSGFVAQLKQAIAA